VDPIKAFERWRKQAPPHTQTLAELLLERVVPAFEQQGFARYVDYAGGRAEVIHTASLQLQRRSGVTWPTVVLRFDPRQRPFIVVDAADLPVICRRYADPDFVDVEREQAAVTEGRAVFYLARRQKGLRNVFGYSSFSLRPKATLSREVDVLLERLPHLFRAFDAGELRRYDPARPLGEWIGLQVSREALFSTS
jgi:hypothetical protein